MNYKITELERKDSTNLVRHSVITPLARLAEWVSYDEARALVERNLNPGDTVTEVYTSTGQVVEYTAEGFVAEQESIREWDKAHVR